VPIRDINLTGTNKTRRRKNKLVSLVAEASLGNLRKKKSCDGGCKAGMYRESGSVKEKAKGACFLDGGSRIACLYVKDRLRINGKFVRKDLESVANCVCTNNNPTNCDGCLYERTLGEC